MSQTGASQCPSFAQYFMKKLSPLLDANWQLNLRRFTFSELREFSREMSELASLSRVTGKVDRPGAMLRAMEILQKYFKTLEPLVRHSLEFTLQHFVHDDAFQIELLTKVFPALEWINCGLQIVLLGDFAAKVVQLWDINKSIREVISEVEYEVQEKFVIIESYINWLHQITTNAELLLLDLKITTLNDCSLRQIKNVLEQVTKELAQADAKSMESIENLIVNLRRKIAAQYGKLQQNEEKLANMSKGAIGGVISGAILAVMSVLQQALGPAPKVGLALASIALPMVVGSMSIIQREQHLKKKMKEIEEHLDRLKVYQADLKDYMICIEQQKERCNDFADLMHSIFGLSGASTNTRPTISQT